MTITSRERYHYSGWKLPGFLLHLLLLLLATSSVAWATGGHGGREGNPSVVFAPDGRTIAFAYGNDGPARLMDAETGEILQVFPVEGMVSDLAFSTDGQVVAVSADISHEPSEGVIRVWSVVDGDELAVEKTPIIYFVRFRDDNHTIVHEFFGNVREWDYLTGTAIETDWNPMEFTHSSDPTGRFIAASAERGITAVAVKGPGQPVTIAETTSEETVQVLLMGSNVQSLFFNADGSTLAVIPVSEPGSVELWNTDSWHAGDPLNPMPRPIEGGFSVDGRQMALYLEDDTIQVWDLLARVPLRQFPVRLPEEDLYVAARDGDTETARRIIAGGADVNLSVSSRAPTPLIVASENGHADIVQALLEAGAIVDLQPWMAFSALGTAARMGHGDIVRMLYSAGANLNLLQYGRDTPLIWAAHYGSPEIVRTLIDLGADVDFQTSAGYTALIFAAQTGRTETVELLLEADADATIQTWQGRTALSMAEEKEHTAIINMLADY